MTKKQIKKLALISFSKNDLDFKKVKRISSKLKRYELREYIKYLKAYDMKKKVVILVPNLKESEKTAQNKEISKLFIGRKIIYREDPELLLGVRIIDNDRIYDFNLKNSFEEMTNYISNI